MYENMMEYIQKEFKKNDINSTKLVEKYLFRNRFTHCKRVCKWVEKLIDEDESIDKESLIIASLFHDIGYINASEGKDHAKHGAEICKEYLLKTHQYEEKIDFISFLIENHSNKELYLLDGTRKELILLMEADLLDETGALGIVWDCMAEGRKEEQSYEATYNHIKEKSGKMLIKNPMITEKAKKYWEEKQKLVEYFIEKLGIDIGIE
jgi:uncharacterized protein